MFEFEEFFFNYETVKNLDCRGSSLSLSDLTAKLLIFSS